MNIYFIGHAYHRETRSSEFFLAILRSMGLVVCVWDESGIGGGQIDIDDEWEAADLIVVWQVEYVVPRLVERLSSRILFVPMFDGAEYLPAEYWAKIRDVYVLCFSSTLYNKVQRHGVKSAAYFQYFLNPDKYQVCDQSGGTRIYLWQRREQPSLKTIERVLGGQECERVILKTAHDPVPGITVPVVSPEDAKKFSVVTVGWNINGCEMEWISSNVYFAPRLVEGIGMSFLEAMAAGMCVCANDYPTMNEYIVHGQTGFLYNASHVREIDIARRAEIGASAREFMSIGYRRWENEQGRLTEFISKASGALERANTTQKVDTEGRQPSDTDMAGLDKVTVAVVTRNAAHCLEKTLESIIEQDYGNVEIVLVDGASTDRTREIISKYTRYIAVSVSEPDSGPYAAMNKAAALGSGKWVIFINAGDRFFAKESLSQLVAGARDDVQFVVAHHLYLRSPGIEEVHRVRSFYTTWEELRGGAVSYKWLDGIPCHQSTLTRRELLVAMKYDMRYQIAADHDLLFRAFAAGAKVHVVPWVTSVYVGGGMSARRRNRCVKEWWVIARTYSEKKRDIDIFYRAVRRETAISVCLGHRGTKLAIRAVRVTRVLVGSARIRAIKEFARQMVIDVKKAWRSS